ncbi:tRNA synthetases class I-domain-containing protein [Microdochium trichocladiopsis]|uniref:Isoleucine--tRNA ligase, mitochondrial n=1 Tax=Microdochium trichocladiopsis TaxID=1682393 RepID=A0A9P8XUK9_9PEZI|nr:tRNA synthetases class I-domain-containing protein [Microdochium trichocladiopsis]KAH7018412.1 tRNA synthetases class I-domain-containing protein [Microdochium trichocladiopsis]
MSKSWSSTLMLPKSTLPPRPLPKTRDLYIQRCADDFYDWQRTNRPSKDLFVIHDGPPYANGSLHVGHALNKILKDMINRVKVQQGRRVNYIPGWDCHGLPIELKALEAAKGKKLSRLEIRKAARNLASNTIVKQMKGFQSYGVMADWKRKWTTMDPSFEIRQLRLFQAMVRKGLIYRKFKPVYWSPSSQTALAEAELEYRDDHVSNAAWIRFPISEAWNGHPQLQKIQDKVSGQLYAVIWTTTPWTLPANRAIGVHDDLNYCVVKAGSATYLVAESRLHAFLPILADTSAEVVATLLGSDLTGLTYHNQLQGRHAEEQSIIHADFVSADSGSGLVHLAPGHGMDDYLVCSAHGISVSAPIDQTGKFTAEAYPDDPDVLCQAPSVIEGGGKKVLELLQAHGDVLSVKDYTHKYPYDWRTKKPVVIRATEQWFADVGSIKKDTLDALEDVRFFPEGGKTRLSSFVTGRSEWCISRQRAWGVPIPVLFDESGTAVVNDGIIEHIIKVIQERGSNAWWSDPEDDPAWIPASLTGKHTRGTGDTMDVWFDSGSSWTMMDNRADVYLEGSDQHRGWFQSSLLTRIAAGAVGEVKVAKGAPFKQLITHGFTLDGEGKKMSKSLGNIIEPHEVMEGSLLPPLKQKGKAAQGPPKYDALGPDALRLWAASGDYTKDVAIGISALQQVQNTLVKYRVIIKMLLGSMHKSARTAPLSVADNIAIIQLEDAMREVGHAFDNHEFHRACVALNKYVSKDLSAFYLEALKDRLYCGDGGGVLEPIFNGLLRMLAPMTPLLVEEAWEHRPQWMKEDSTVIHPLHQLYNDPLVEPDRLRTDIASVRGDVPTIMMLHSAVMSCLELARTDKRIGSGLQSHVVLQVQDEKVQSVLGRYTEDELAMMFVVSSLDIVKDAADVQKDGTYIYEHKLAGDVATVYVLPPKAEKCPRCWRYQAPAEDALCGRCEDLVAQ